jgi:hypothetical protein
MRSVQSIRKIGKCFSSFIVFKSKCAPYLRPLAFMRLDVTPLACARQRAKKLKFLFSVADLNSLFDASFTQDNCLEKLRIVQLGRRVLSALSCERTHRSHIYRSLVLPMSSVKPEKPELHCYTLVNQFAMKPVYEGSVLPQYLSDASLLTPVFREMKFIGQFIKKTVERFNKRVIVSYIIFTVKYYKTLDFYSIEIYVPKTSRRFTCILYLQNFS